MNAPAPLEKTVCWPQWLEECRIDDAAMAQAYDSTALPLRAAVKNCIALCHAVYGEGASATVHSITNSAAGYWHSRSTQAAPWALLLFSPAYTAASRMAAALMPAILAHVPRIGALCVGGMPSQAARLTLELTGVEDGFISDEDDALALVQTMHSLGAGRLMLLHTGELAALASAARKAGIVCFEECAEPHLVVAQGHSIHADILHFAHGAACPVLHEQAESKAACTQYSAYYCSTAPAQALPYDLVLTQGMEGCWLHKALSREFFTNTSIKAGMLEHESPLFGGGRHEGAE